MPIGSPMMPPTHERSDARPLQHAGAGPVNATNIVIAVYAGMRRTNPEDHIRTRIRLNFEIVAIWASTDDGLPFSRYARLRLLTGARRSEAMLPWPELNTKGVWTSPARRNKVKFDLERPLSKLAVSELVMNGETHAFSFTNAQYKTAS